MNKCVLCGYIVDWQSEHFKMKKHWYHASCSIKRIEELEAECEDLGGELESLRGDLEVSRKKTLTMKEILRLTASEGCG